MGVFWFNRFRKGTFDRPTIAQSFMDDPRTNVKMPRPLVNSLSLSSKTNLTIVPFVVVLFACGCPSAVVGGVRPIVVSPVQRQPAFVCWKHIGIEGFKLVPPFAHKDSSASVVVKFGIIGPVASAVHRDPHVVDGMLAETMSYTSQLFSVGSEAPTGPRSLPGQFTTADKRDLPTGATAHPFNVVSTPSNNTYRSESPEPDSGEVVIDFVSMNPLDLSNWVCYNEATHGCFLSKRLCLEAVSGYTHSRPRFTSYSISSRIVNPKYAERRQKCL